ncbi:hypothetical protein [Streptomyces sp. NPDC002057]|uniref:hypothetical protein n=1 Tax=Streptomyces sp. NPDC002057 TaxID=3154664 RepID=UPI0033217613
MSNSEGPATEPDTEVGHPGIVEPVLDMDLRLLVDLMDSDEAKEAAVGVTLNVPGGIVSGNIIGREAYLDSWDALTRGSGMSGLSGFQREAERALDRAGVPKPTDFPRWIHLRDAAVMTPNQLVRFPIWRGRLADVSGWFLGVLRDDPKA